MNTILIFIFAVMIFLAIIAIIPFIFDKIKMSEMKKRNRDLFLVEKNMHLAKLTNDGITIDQVINDLGNRHIEFSVHEIISASGDSHR